MEILRQFRYPGNDEEGRPITKTYVAGRDDEGKPFLFTFYGELRGDALMSAITSRLWERS